jgi:hypothetical protein
MGYDTLPPLPKLTVRPGSTAGTWILQTPGCPDVEFVGSSQKCARFMWRLRLMGHVVVFTEEQQVDAEAKDLAPVEA